MVTWLHGFTENVRIRAAPVRPVEETANYDVLRFFSLETFTLSYRVIRYNSISKFIIFPKHKIKEFIIFQVLMW